MGSRPRHSNRATGRTRRDSGSQTSTRPDLPEALAAFADGLAVLETVAAALEATETHAAATVTLRFGIRAVLNAHAQIEAAAGGAA